jgi:putative hydrolase of the HAD superfamily
VIRAILFDLDGTLIDCDRLWRRCIEGVLADHPQSVPPETRARVLASVADTPLLERRLVARILGRESSFCADSSSAVLGARFCGLIEPDPVILRLLDNLSTRYVTAIVSNGSRRAQRAKLERAELTRAVGRVFISGELGVRKPDPAIFQRVLGWAGVEAGEALIVGDHPYDDIQGGQRAGLRTCAVGPAYAEDWPRPDLRIDHISELPGVLR